MSVEVMHMRINVTMPEDLISRLDEYAQENHVSRSALICMASSQFLMAHEMRSTLREIKNAMKSIAETKDLTEEQSKQMDDICRAIALMNGE